MLEYSANLRRQAKIQYFQLIFLTNENILVLNKNKSGGKSSVLFKVLGPPVHHPSNINSKSKFFCVNLNLRCKPIQISVYLIICVGFLHKFVVNLKLLM